MAIGLLIQSKQMNIDEIQSFGFIGELSLNADIRACSGILPMTIEAKKRGITNLIVPKENVREASLVKGINIFGFEKLTEVISFLEGITPYTSLEDLKCEHVIQKPYLFDFQDVQGQDAIIEFIVATAAGGHNLIMSGAPGCGKSMIAKRIPSILPSMTERDSKKLLQMAFDRFNYSARTFHKFLKVARTFADMDGAEKLGKRHVAKALMCRDLDKEQVNIVVI